MILALKGRLARELAPVQGAASPYGELAEALAEMGYDKRAALDALAAAAAKAEGTLPPGTGKAEKEKLLFREAIVYLSGQ
jgi:hypothetical protein